MTISWVDSVTQSQPRTILFNLMWLKRLSDMGNFSLRKGEEDRGLRHPKWSVQIERACVVCIRNRHNFGVSVCLG